MKHSVLFLISSLLFIISACFAEEAEVHKFVDKTVAGIVVGEDRQEKVVELFGQGTTVQEGFALCYHAVKEEQTVVFELGPDKIIEGIILSDARKSDCKTISLQDGNRFRTGKGISLGDSQNRVLEIYGEPQKREAKDGMIIIEYHTDHEKDPQVRLFYDALLYFRGDTLVKLAIHDGE
jgi:hypothetical protein